MIMNDSWKERGAIIMETDQHYCSDGTAAIQRGICADSVSAFVIGLQSNCLSMPKLRVVKAKIESTKISPVSLRNKWRINFGLKKKIIRYYKCVLFFLERVCSSFVSENQFECCVLAVS